jgi:hypothetical protein
MSGIMMSTVGNWKAVAAVASGPTLVYDLDATNYSAVPTTGSTVAGTGAYTITVANAGSRLGWSATNNGIFTFGGAATTTTDTMYGGPNWVTGQNYSVFMAYQRTNVANGRLLNTNNEASADWLMGLYNGNPDTFYPNATVNLPGSGADLIWHFGWATLNVSTGVGQLYTATSSQPTGTAFSVTNAGFRGFNQLRMFSRASGSEVQTGNIGFIKVYDGVLSLATVQSLYATYKTRFGY